MSVEPTSKVVSEPIEALLDKVASAQSSPGGGSVAAVVAAFGIALISMSVALSRKQGGGAGRVETLTGLGRLLEQAKALSSEDVATFDAFLESRRARKPAQDRQALAAQCVRVPLRGLAVVEEALETGVEADSLVGKALRSDLRAGASLLGGTIGAFAATARANLPCITDTETRSNLEQEIRDAEAKASAAFERAAQAFHVTP